MSDHVQGDNLIIWEFDYAFTTFYEVDTDQITSLLPKELSPMEIVPGVSLLNITAFNFPKGGLGHLPNFQELIAAIVVAPDLSRGVPKFAMYVFSLGSTSQAHLDHSADYYNLPSYNKLDYGKINRDKNEVEFGDNDGSILTMNNCSNDVGAYLGHERYFQAFVSKDDDIYKKAKLLRSWGRSSSIFDEKSEAIENRFNVKIGDIDYDAKFIFEEIGYNLEGSEIGAAFGLAQLENLDKNIKERIKNFNTQTKFFETHGDYFITPQITKSANTAWLAYPVIIKENAPFKRRDFQIYLEKNNIQTRTVFTGNITKQPGFKNVEMRKINSLKNSDNIMKNAVLLACHHGLTKEMIDHMHNTIEDFIKTHK